MSQQGLSFMGMLSLKGWHASAGVSVLSLELLLIVCVQRCLIGHFWHGILAFASGMATRAAALCPL